MASDPISVVSAAPVGARFTESVLRERHAVPLQDGTALAAPLAPLPPATPGKPFEASSG